MELPIIRINRISLSNIKCVSSGSIDLNTAESLRIEKASILGIYGQNGSGKTVVIEALDIIKSILLGRQIPKRYLESITFGETNGTLEVEFAVVGDDSTDCIAVYKCALEQRDNPNETSESSNIGTKVAPASILAITSESLKISGQICGVKYPAQYIAQTDEKERLIRPKHKCRILFGENENSLKLLELQKVLAFYGSRSFIFSNQALNSMKGAPESDFAHVVFSLRSFAEARLFITGGEMQSGIPFPINFVDEYGNDSGTVGQIPFSLESKAVLQKRIVDIIKSFLPPLNNVLSSMIPGLNINFKYQKTSIDEKDDKYEVELFSSRVQGYEIPLRYESLGIKRIISYLSVLIAAFNDPHYVLVVDEFDSSVFEFLLGELVSVFKESGKGQLIFTSHNLRPLEKLNDVSIFFTTTDPKNRYVRLKKKTTNNLRDVYFRAISLGNKDFELYNSESKHVLALAFRKAGWKE